MWAISSGSISRWRRDCRRWPHEGALGLVPGQVAVDELVDEVLDAAGVGRSRDDRVHRHARAGRLLGEAAAHREQGGLGHAVVDHLGGDDDRRVAGDVLHAPPAAFGHAGQDEASEAHGRQDVHVEVAAPLLVADLQGVGGLEDAEVVDEDVHLTQRVHGLPCTLVGGHVGGDGHQVGAGDLALHPVHGLPDPPGRAAVDAHPGARPGQAGGDRGADALRGAGDQGGAALQIDPHAVSALSVRE
jgi:hypothetical protein